MLLDISVLSPQEIIFSGRAKSVIVPGEQGVFEVLPFHKCILSRLVSGALHIDKRSFPIQRGLIKVYKNNVTILVEEK